MTHKHDDAHGPPDVLADDRPALEKLRAVTAPPALEAAQLQRIENQISRRLRERLPWQRWIRRVALGVGLGAPLAFAAIQGGRNRERAASAALENTHDALTPAPRPELGPAPKNSPPPSELPVDPVAPSSTRPAAAHPRGADTLSEEGRLLSQALRQLRGQRDPRAALETLADYDGRFPRGQLREEAGFARVEALLASTRASDALVALDQLEAGRALTGPSGSRARLSRGEILLALHRAAEALPLFETVAREARVAQWQERALFGRAACERALARDEQARAAFADYLARFPKGRYAAEAARALSGL